MRQRSLLAATCAGTLLALSSTPLLAGELRNEPIQPIPLASSLDQSKVKLGRDLFFDTKLSKDHTISCASCHTLAKGGADGEQFSAGVAGKRGGRNSPTVINSKFNFKQFWDGRARTLEEQAAGPVHNPVEMDANWPLVESRLAADSSYVAAFKAIYGGVPKGADIQDAIAEFERSLVAVNSPFDQYLRGDAAALDSRQKRGYKLFKRYGCSGCHQGVNVGGNMFQVFGAMKKVAGTGVAADDLGRYDVTGNEADKYVFKVPSLRLASLTAPYFHDGSVATLEEAIDVMAEYQLRRRIPTDERDDIAAFIKSLAGKLPE